MRETSIQQRREEGVRGESKGGREEGGREVWLIEHKSNKWELEGSVARTCLSDQMGYDSFVHCFASSVLC